MFELIFVWILAAIGGATLGFLGFCLTRNLFKAFAKAAFIDEKPNDAVHV